MIAPAQLAQTMYKRMKQMLTILGWDLKKKKGSLEPPRATFECLGVGITFKEGPVIEVANTVRRIDNIEATYKEHEARGTVSGQEIAAIRGKMQFSTAQCMGKIGANTFHVLNKVDSCAGPRWFSPDLKGAITWWIQAVRDMPPRTLDYRDRRLPIKIFSDGACEGEKFAEVTYGAVLIDPEDGAVEAFGATMGVEMIRLLGEDGRKTQLIGQAEILPMLVSRILWSGRVQNRDVIHYVDNDAARYSCIKGGSPCLGSAWLIQ